MMMRSISGHVTRTFIAGIVALLPIAGIVLTVVYLESMISSSWLARQPYYFPGMGLVAAALLIYLIGLAVSNIIGRWVFGRVDRLLDKLPALGSLYQTIKQILGYGEGPGALFERVVLMPATGTLGDEIGLVTREFQDGAGRDLAVVFIPFAPTPTSGRLVVIETHLLRPVEMTVNDAFKASIALGKSNLVIDAPPSHATKPII